MEDWRLKLWALKEEKAVEAFSAMIEDMPEDSIEKDIPVEFILQKIKNKGIRDKAGILYTEDNEYIFNYIQFHNFMNEVVTLWFSQCINELVHYGVVDYVWDDKSNEFKFKLSDTFFKNEQ